MRTPPGWLETTLLGGIYSVTDLPWEHLGIPHKDVKDMARERDYWAAMKPVASMTWTYISGGKWMEE